MRRSLDADAKMVGLCGDHARCNTSSVCASNVCSGFPSLLMSCNKIVCLKYGVSHPRGAACSEANLVCASGNEECLCARIKGDGQYLLIVCLHGRCWRLLSCIPAERKFPFLTVDVKLGEDLHFKHLVIAYANKHVFIRCMPINVLCVRCQFHIKPRLQRGTYANDSGMVVKNIERLDR